MRRGILYENNVDENGAPTGGCVTGTGIQIQSNDAPLGQLDPSSLIEANRILLFSVDDLRAAFGAGFEYARYPEYGEPESSAPLDAANWIADLVVARGLPVLESEQLSKEGE